MAPTGPSTGCIVKSCGSRELRGPQPEGILAQPNWRIASNGYYSFLWKRLQRDFQGFTPCQFAFACASVPEPSPSPHEQHQSAEKISLWGEGRGEGLYLSPLTPTLSPAMGLCSQFSGIAGEREQDILQPTDI